MADFSPWLPLTAASLESMPDEAAIYEIGTLVRSVLLIGAATRGTLRNTLASLMQPHGVPLPPGRLYFRYKPSPDPALEARQQLNRYRRTHKDSLPRWQNLFPRRGQLRLPAKDAGATSHIVGPNRAAGTGGQPYRRAGGKAGVN